MPGYATVGAAAMDICSAEDYNLTQQEFRAFSTGFAVAIPQGFEMQCRPRSGFATKYGITITNSPGTIDSDYRGEIKVILHNLGACGFPVERGDRIAQLVLAPVTIASVEEVNELDETIRGAGGFGSTGRN